MKLENILEVILIIAILFMVATLPTIIINRQYLLENISVCGGSKWLTSETYEKDCKCYNSELKESKYIIKKIENPVEKTVIPLFIMSFIIFMTTLFNNIKYKEKIKIRVLSLILLILNIITFFAPVVLNEIS